MNMRYGAVLALLVFIFGSAGASSVHAQASQAIIKRSQNRPLPSLSQAAARARAEGPRFQDLLYQVPNKPLQGGTRTQEGAGKTTGAAPVQQTQGTATTDLLSSFDGADNEDNLNKVGFRVAPPDTDADVGGNHIVQMINLVTTIFNKSDGTEVEAPFPTNAFWSGAGGLCETYNQGDPIVVYDEAGGRWLVSQFAFDDNFRNFAQCVAISETDDPTGSYHRYEFSFNDIGFNDYPKHGIVSESITMMANIFQPRGPFFTFSGTFVGVMDKDAMYAGNSATLVGFTLNNEFGFVAGDLDSASGSAIPALFATAMSNSAQFDIWEIDIDWTNPGGASAGRIAALPITPFDADICSASREECIPQPGTTQRLEAISDRLMQRLQIRDFGTHRTMMASHTVDVGGGRTGVRWYELRETGGTWSLYQEGTYGPSDGLYRWMPSIAMNAAGDIGLGYLVSNGTDTYMSTAVAGQTAASSGTGVLDAAETFCITGSGAQTGTARAGDYSATVVDPTSDTFWHTNEYMPTTNSAGWATHVCEFAPSGDGGSTNTPPTASFTADCTDLTCDFDGTGSSDSDGSIASYDWDFGDGNTATGGTVSHTYANGDTYTVALTVTDDDGATNSTAQDVTVQESGSPSELFVDSIVAEAQNEGRGNKRGMATVTIVDGQGTAASEVTVGGYFTGTFNDPASGTTGSDGSVTFSTSTAARGGVTVDFCVDSVVKDGYEWAQSPQVCSGAAKTDDVLASSEVPGAFTLEQNYPNPFNPATVLAYTLPEDSQVRLRVFNVLGQEVATVVDAYQEAGRHERTFDAAQLSAGVYLYTIRAGRFVATRRMTLLK